jgi:hypothetical protein
MLCDTNINSAPISNKIIRNPFHELRIYTDINSRCVRTNQLIPEENGCTERTDTDRFLNFAESEIRFY